jgi:SAM-dependent methyltransferase
MAQSKAWDREYRKPQLLSKENKPQSDIVRAVKELKKLGFFPKGRHVLDIGSGIGRNSFYFNELGANSFGLEISQTAIKTAEDYVKGINNPPQFILHDIGTSFPFKDGTFDLALDIVSSNSLSENEREICLKETHRVLKSGGFFLIKVLNKDGDTNAKNLLAQSPGKEKDTYILQELGLTERVFSREDFLSIYGADFNLISLTKKTSYPRMNNRVYKRNYLIGLWQKP